MRQSVLQPDMPETTPDYGVIPLVDEISFGESEPVATPTAPGPSTVDRELGLADASTSSGGRYTCPCCRQGAIRVVRVRPGHRPGWSAVCAMCAAALLSRIPGTIVGGMVRPTRRRRRLEGGRPADGSRRVDRGGYRRAG